MKIDKTTYEEKGENQIGLTADHTSRPDKVLFFCRPTLHTLSSRICRHTNQSLPKSAILPTLN